MTDCSSIQGSTSSSSDVMSSSHSGVVSSTPRIRVVRLVRPNSKRILITPDGNVTYGFAVRGGKEFGTGFFVSKIDKNSEADIKGLRVGDQIIRVNGYHVDDAVHKELTQYISSQDRLTLKVRGVGMIPLKESQEDALTWHIVPTHVLSALTALDDYSHTSKEIRVVLKVAPRSKLGLGICKGPEWKPGIFVQFTKDFSVARDAGLRPGDQILSCNSIDFSDVLFSEAVAVMKGSSTLEMVVKTAAGLDLFPGESSGYNSSASSVTGDQSPCWGDQAAKRLTAVREEPSGKHWTRHKTDPPNTSPPPPPPPASGSNKTIIQLSENGTMINNTVVPNSKNAGEHNSSYAMPRPGSQKSPSPSSSTSDSHHSCSSDKNFKLSYITPPDYYGRQQQQHYRVPLIPPPPSALNNGQASNNDSKRSRPKTIGNGKIADICFVSRQSETKTVIVEVHQNATGDSEENRTQMQTPPAPKPPPCPSPSTSPLQMSSTPSCTAAEASGKRSTSPDTNTNSSTTQPQPLGGLCLGSAISEELKKRQHRRLTSNTESAFSNSESLEPRQQPTPNGMGNSSIGGDSNSQRHTALMDEFKRAHRRMFKNGFVETDKKAERQEELSKTTIMKDEVDHRSTDQLDFKTEANNNHNSTVIGYFPTPPPPPQFANKPPTKNGVQHSSSQVSKPPDSPTPDYDTIPRRQPNGTSPYRNGSAPNRQSNTISRVAKAENAKANGEIAEMESIDSYQMKYPTSPTPRPPSMYFDPQSFKTNTNTLRKGSNKNRPVSVTIGEYASTQIVRKEPSKFDFIGKSGENGNKEENVSDLLRNELEMTLSRSNLKKQTENGNALKYQNGDSAPVSRNSVLEKTQSTNIEKLTKMLQSKQSLFEINNNNRSATISSSNRNSIGGLATNKKQALRKTESTPPSAAQNNGILKNGYAKPSLAEKSISFGN